MASTGKKGKKNKGVVVSLQSFLANGNTQPGVTQVSKKVRNRPDESDDEDNHSLPQIYQLPTAPRASRFLDDDAIPNKPPFQAYISNLPFDVHEDDIQEFFGDMEVISLRLPREEGEQGRLRGFGYIEFATREDLIAAVRLPDPHIRNRRIRIDISNESDNRRGGMNRSRYDGFGGSNREESNTWRREGNEGGREEGRRGGYGYNRDRQRDNSEDGGSWRAAERPNTETSPSRRSGYGDGFRDRGERGGGDRDRGFGGGRRGGDRDDYRRPPPPPEEPEQDRPKLNLKPRTLPLPEIITQPDEKSDGEEQSSTPEPPKVRPAGVASENIFGSAKPVDTAAREKEIEERLENERLEKNREQEEEREQEEKEITGVDDERFVESQKDEKENRNVATSWRKRDDDIKHEDDNSYRKYSPDRRGPPRRNEDRRVGGNQRDNRDNGPPPSRDRRDYRDNRGYERDNRYRDNRNEQRSDRDQYNRDRAAPAYNRDNKSNVRDNRRSPPITKDEKPKKENRPEKPMPKYQPPQGGPVLSNANKYSGLLDDDDTSE